MRIGSVLRGSLPVLAVLLTACGAGSPEIGINHFTNIRIKNNTMVRSGEHLYVATTTGITVLEFSRPDLSANPRVLATLEPVFTDFHTIIDPHNTHEDVVGLYVNGTVLYAVIGANRALLSIIDIADPTNPRLLTKMMIVPKGSEFRGFAEVAFSGNVAVIAMRKEGVGLYDVSNPADPRLIVMHPVEANQVFVDGKTAYVTANNRLTVLDITTPTAITTIGASPEDATFGTTEPGPGIALDPRGYIWNGNGRTAAVVESRDLAQLRTVTTTFEAETGWADASAIRLKGQWLYVAELDRFKGYDVSDPSNPVLKQTIGPDGDLALISNFEVTDDGYMFLSHEKGIYMYGHPQN